MNLEEEPPLGPRDRLRRKQIYALMVVALLGAVAAGVLLASSVWQWKWNTHGAQQTKMTVVQTDPTKRCVLQTAVDAIKSELFRRAAQTRGRDPNAYARIAGFSLLRIDAPSVVREDGQHHVVDCTGTANLELPPQISLAAGGTMISGPIDYSVQFDPSGNPTGVVVGDAGFITGPLATISTLAPPEPLTVPQPNDQVSPEQQQPEPQQNDAQSPPDEEQRQLASANPSNLRCGNGNSPGESIVCNDQGLSRLDRQMAIRLSQAMSEADPAQERLLQATGDRFAAYRDRCQTSECAAQAYLARLREIRDIMNGEWQPPR